MEADAAETLISYEIDVKAEKKKKKKRTLWEICTVDERDFRVSEPIEPP